MPAKVKHPIVQTTWGFRTLRARLSLRETQKEFSNRFRVTTVTICNWENGKSRFIQKIHQEIMDSLERKLQKDHALCPDEVVTVALRERIEKRGDALR